MMNVWKISVPRLHQIYGVEFEISPELTDRVLPYGVAGENIREILHFFELTAPVKCALEEGTSSSDSVRIAQKIFIRPNK